MIDLRIDHKTANSNKLLKNDHLVQNRDFLKYFDIRRFDSFLGHNLPLPIHHKFHKIYADANPVD